MVIEAVDPSGNPFYELLKLYSPWSYILVIGILLPFIIFALYLVKDSIMYFGKKLDSLTFPRFPHFPSKGRLKNSPSLQAPKFDSKTKKSKKTKTKTSVREDYDINPNHCLKCRLGFMEKDAGGVKRCNICGWGGGGIL